jgi:hypothetical protein
MAKVKNKKDKCLGYIVGREIGYDAYEPLRSGMLCSYVEMCEAVDTDMMAVGWRVTRRGDGSLICTACRRYPVKRGYETGV